ncbi:hypothetical protein EMPS_05639 [Entomortierella parvispora]|uniref:Uncharacterized protein n=1 Tax=Entomortierella parvispora TaxID=205924 RepID=A0A9P3HAT2_9FUNG|nr:hypothetical protein EMPS_05639 [Entomortierella parvispora]
MPRSTFVQQDFFLGVLAVYSATVAFGRWFPDTDLIAVDAHPASYATTFKNSSESALQLYAASLVIDIIRVLALSVLESTAFSFAFAEDKFEPFSYAFMAFSMIMVTKDLLVLGMMWALPDVHIQAAEKVAELMPISVMMEQGLILAGALSLAFGLYQWTFAIGRDKRQVIEKEKTN